MDDVMHQSCLVCASTELTDLKNYQKAYLCQCNSCNFIFSRKIPSDKDLKRYYSDDYDRTRYFSHITYQRYKELLLSFESSRKTNKILDIGCGYGFFLTVAKELGWEVYGTELSNKAAEHCIKNGISMHLGDLDTNTFSEHEFDVIVAIELIEHINTPKAFAEQTHRLLRKGGKLYITTPNFNSILRYRLKEKSDIIEFPNHLTYFTPKTLKHLFTKNGFKTLNIKTTGLSITRIKTSKGISNQEFVSETSDDEMLRYKIENNALLRFFKRIINWKLNLFKVGNSLKGTFEK